ncbi:MAG TPA: UDP-N-acetylmuramoyl-L-alanyl-D-glutamate--2,6-diaminopimelate ligase [Gemmatimonadales bacterium]
MSPFDLQAFAKALDQAGELREPVLANVAIAAVVDDSRRAQGGALFCAVPGTAKDGHAFAAEAVQRGAVALLVTRKLNLGVPELVVRDARRGTAIVSAVWYGAPADAFTLIGVTGTNGKSTTVALIRHLFNATHSAGSLGTLGALDGAGHEVAVGNLTTPGAVELQGTLAALRDRAVKTLAFEASSHALDQRRIEGLHLAAAVYTNLTHDHLDYHGDLAAYFAAKAKLSAYLKPDGVEIVNADDRAWRALDARPGIRRVRWSVAGDADVRATNVQLSASGSTFRLSWGGRTHDVRLPLLGDFNVSNALGAAATALALSVAPDTVVGRLASAPQVPGRMERLAGEAFAILRDYAHTPDALERAIRTLRPLTPGRLLVLFGCGGDRDRQKRPVMGRIAAQGSDVSIVTSDNPRTEDPDRIIDDIEGGMDGKAHLRIADRREAIARAVSMLAAGDTLLLAGKGHETYQVVGTQRLPMDEREIVSALVGARSA